MAVAELAVRQKLLVVSRRISERQFVAKKCTPRRFERFAAAEAGATGILSINVPANEHDDVLVLLLYAT